MSRGRRQEALGEPRIRACGARGFGSGPRPRLLHWARVEPAWCPGPYKPLRFLLAATL